MSKYFGLFTDLQQMLDEWRAYSWNENEKVQYELPGPVPDEGDILFASYGAKDYEGDAFVLFQKGGKLYEVNGEHCSCYGLGECRYSGNEVKSQWSPEETSWAALASRKLRDDQHEPEALVAFRELVQEHL